jgi:hypothetical protein
LFAGSRPSTTPAQSEVVYGTQLSVTVPNAAGINSAALIRPGATTHSSDLEQRLVDLPLAVTGADTLKLQLPASPNLAPPGWYLLFVLNQAAIPSPAAWVHLT